MSTMYAFLAAAQRQVMLPSALPNVTGRWTLLFATVLSTTLLKGGREDG